MKFIHVAILALTPLCTLAMAQAPAPKAPAPAAVAPVVSKPPAKDEAKKEPTCEKKDMKNGKCPKVFPKAPKPTDKQLEDAKKKADTKK